MVIRIIVVLKKNFYTSNEITPKLKTTIENNINFTLNESLRVLRESYSYKNKLINYRSVYRTLFRIGVIGLISICDMCAY